MHRVKSLWLGSLVVAAVSAAPNAMAQDAVPSTRMISVEGIQMRIETAGTDQRKPGQPVVVLEAGAGDPKTAPLDTWSSVFSRIAGIAPVVAYERRGNGMSAADTERPTMRRVANVLHALLRDARVAPPYVLVGHSWGGNYIRAFVDQYPNEVVGMVFIDAETGAGSTREEKAAVLPAEHRAEALAPPVLPPFPPETPPGLRAELEEIGKEMISDGQEARTFKPLPPIPVAIVIATPPGRMRGDSGAVTRLGIQRALELALASPSGMLVTADHVGHFVHKDDPALVVQLIQHVLSHPPRPVAP